MLASIIDTSGAGRLAGSVTGHPDEHGRQCLLRPHGLNREARVVDSDDSLAVPVATNGGFVSVVCKYAKGMSTCDQPVRRVPQTNLTVTPAQAEARPGSTIDVRGTFTLPEGGPINDVALRATPPAGWRVSGATVSKKHLRAGESISGAWTATAPPDAAPGYVDVPVVATYRFSKDPQQRPVHVEEAVRVHPRIRAARRTSATCRS